MRQTIIFAGSSKSTLALSRYEKLRKVALEKRIRSIWLEKKSGLGRSLTFFQTLFLILFHRRNIWVCHGSYWPELLLVIITRQKYSLIVQGSELNVTGRLRKFFFRIMLSNAFTVGCRTLEQVKIIEVISPPAVTFILRMDEYALPIFSPSMERNKIISIRASAPLYRQDGAAIISKLIKNILKFKTRTLYICYNGPDRDPYNIIFDKKIMGPIDQSSLTNLLASAHHVISIPKTDGLSNVVIEALIQGALIISSEASFKEEFAQFRDRFIVIPENKMKNKKDIENFLRTKLEAISTTPNIDQAREIHRNFSYDQKSLGLLIGIEI